MTRLTLRRAPLVLLLALLVVSALARVVSASLEAIPRTAPPDGPIGLLCPPSDEVSDLLAQLAARDAALEAREVDLALREQDLRIAGQEVRAALSEMAAAQAALEARMYASDIAAEEDVTRLVAVYEGMKPKEAAALFEAMESNFAAGFLARMRPEVAAEVFSKMSPEKAYALSAVIAGRNADAATGVEQ
jgi:flagellar motility protein MotE (MotC chaperone)